MVDYCGIQSSELFAFQFENHGAIQKGKYCEVDLYVLPLAIFVVEMLQETKHVNFYFLRETLNVFH